MFPSPNNLIQLIPLKALRLREVFVLAQPCYMWIKAQLD